MAVLVDGCPLAILGGDAREVELMRALAAGGARLRVVGLPTEGVAAERFSDPAAAVRGARAVIAPMRGSDARGFLPTPLDPEAQIRLDGRLLAAIGRRRPLFIGTLGPALAQSATALGVRVVELASVDEIAVANSVPTAEGAVSLAMERLPVTIHGCKALVLGFGRCGTTLAGLLAAMGADVGVVARRAADRARIAAMGLEPWPWSRLTDAVADRQVIFNTVPAVVLTAAVLAATREDVLIIDIASPPGGTNFEAARRLGRDAVLARGLPGKTAPVTAGRILAEYLPGLIRAELERL